MTGAEFPYDIASWPMDNLVDFDMGPGPNDELNLRPFIASDFALTGNEELDPSWREQTRWLNDYPAKSSASQPYPQSWYDAGLVRQDCGLIDPPMR
jgi:hypothetical protein